MRDDDVREREQGWASRPAPASAVVGLLAGLPRERVVGAAAHVLAPVGVTARVHGSMVAVRGAAAIVDPDRLLESVQALRAGVLAGAGPGDGWVRAWSCPAGWLAPVRVGARVRMVGAEALFGSGPVWVDAGVPVCPWELGQLLSGAGRSGVWVRAGVSRGGAGWGRLQCRGQCQGAGAAARSSGCQWLVPGVVDRFDLEV